MFGWDLWRGSRIHPALLAGGLSLIGAELGTAWLFFSPAWNAMAMSLVHAWGHAVGL